LVGCASYTDISHDPRYKTDYAIDAVYRVKKPLFIEYQGLRAGSPPTMENVWDSSAHGFFARPRRTIPDVVAVGTRIKVTRITLIYDSYDGDFSVEIKGVILDGDLASRKQVRLNGISRDDRGVPLTDYSRIRSRPVVPMVDRQILEPAGGS
jgi:hypothetical protein